MTVFPNVLARAQTSVGSLHNTLFLLGTCIIMNDNYKSWDGGRNGEAMIKYSRSNFGRLWQIIPKKSPIILSLYSQILSPLFFQR